MKTIRNDEEVAILALDLATKTGYAVLRSGIVESGVRDFGIKRGESPGMRYINFNNWLITLIPRMPMDLVIYEMPHNRGGAATEILNGMVTRVQEFCARYNIQHCTVHSSTLKKFATGSGRAGKDEMIEAARKKFNRDVEDDNEADALWILEYARKKYFQGE